MTDRELTFYLEKSPQYREIQIDGALGGPAPSGNKITMTVYVERSAIPKELVHNISDKGKCWMKFQKEGVAKKELSEYWRRLYTWILSRQKLLINGFQIKSMNSKKLQE